MDFISILFGISIAILLMIGLAFLFTGSSERCKHKFKPRYDTQKTFPEWMSKMTRMQGYLDQALETKTTYVQDICVKCGQTIKRNQQ